MPGVEPRRGYRRFEGIGDEYTVLISVTGGATETFDLTDFPIARGNIILIQITAYTGTTDCDLSIHEDTGYDKIDMIYRATGISINDDEPTGGPPPGISGLVWDENNGESTLHIKTVENSGNSGYLYLRIRYV